MSEGPHFFGFVTKKFEEVRKRQREGQNLLKLVIEAVMMVRNRGREVYIWIEGDVEGRGIRIRI